MMTALLKTKHNQGVHGSVTLALTRPDLLILVTSVWLEHVGKLSGAYSHVSPSSDFIMKCVDFQETANAIYILFPGMPPRMGYCP